MLKNALILILVVVATGQSIEYTYRIEALGVDFAYLIPDYETDLYRNPELLGGKTLGISFDRAYAPIPPMGLICLLKGFGVSGRYWPVYSYSLQPQAQDAWTSTTSYKFSFKDFWMLRIKNEVWNLYNDGSFTIHETRDSYAHTTLMRDIKYFSTMNGNFRIGERLDLNIRLGMGIYHRLSQVSTYADTDQVLLLPSGRINLTCRNAPTINRFTSWYIELGGPISIREIDELPYSIMLRLYDVDRVPCYFAETFMAKLAYARGLPLREKSFFAIGIKDQFLYQVVEEADTTLGYKALVNTFTIPMAVEYVVNTVSIRFGVRLHYGFNDYVRSDRDTAVHETINHSLGYGYSFGMGWQPTERFIVDLYNSGNFEQLRYWSVYIKYLF